MSGIDNIAQSVGDSVQSVLGEDSYAEVNSKSVSVTDNIRSICDETDIETQRLSSFEVVLWSEERPRCVGRIMLVASKEFVYIKWTRILVEGEGVGTAVWDSIVGSTEQTVFAKPVHEAMEHIAMKIGFETSDFDPAIVVTRNE